MKAADFNPLIAAVEITRAARPTPPRRAQPQEEYNPAPTPSIAGFGQPPGPPPPSAAYDGPPPG